MRPDRETLWDRGAVTGAIIGAAATLAGIWAACEVASRLLLGCPWKGLP